MSDSEEEKTWCPFGGNVPPPSPSKARVLPMFQATELLERRRKFWAAHEALQTQMKKVKLHDDKPKIVPNIPEVNLPHLTESSIQLSHPGPPRPCQRTEREPDFDPVSFVLDRCRNDPVLKKKFLNTSRKQFLTILHRGFSLESWSSEERYALAGHILLLGAIASSREVGAACERHLRSEQCSLDAVVIVALSWGAASEDLHPRKDLCLTGLTPARPSQWCLTYTLRALTSLLRPPTQPNDAGLESTSSKPSRYKVPALADVAMAVRALALCALDAGPGQAAEYIPVFASAFAAAQPLTEETVTSLADALHFPNAHPHSQAWLLEHLVREHPLRKRMAHRQLLALLSPTADITNKPMETIKTTEDLMGGSETDDYPMRELESEEEPMSDVDDNDNLQLKEKTEPMEVTERPASSASTVCCESDVLSVDPYNMSLAGLVRLLACKRRHIDAMDSYRKFIFLLILLPAVGHDPVESTDDAMELQKLITWLAEMLMTQPVGTCRLDIVMIQSLVAATTSLWQRTIERSATDYSFMLSQGSQSSLVSS